MTDILMFRWFSVSWNTGYVRWYNLSLHLRVHFPDLTTSGTFDRNSFRYSYCLIYHLSSLGTWVEPSFSRHFLCLFHVQSITILTHSCQFTVSPVLFPVQLSRFTFHGFVSLSFCLVLRSHTFFLVPYSFIFVYIYDKNFKFSYVKFFH